MATGSAGAGALTSERHGVRRLWPYTRACMWAWLLHGLVAAPPRIKTICTLNVSKIDPVSPGAPFLH